jgi:hypothetical protein
MIKKSQIIEVGLSFRKIILNSSYGLPKKYLNNDVYHGEYTKLKILHKRLLKIEKIWKSGLNQCQ